MRADRSTPQASGTAAAQEAAREAARLAVEMARKGNTVEAVQPQAPSARDGHKGANQVANAWEEAAERPVELEQPDDPDAHFSEIARQLDKSPDLKNYPKEAIETFAALRGADHPELQKALDKVASRVLNDKDFDVADLKRTPGLAQLIAASGSSRLKDKLQEKITEYAKERLERHLKDKKGEKGVEEATQKFEDDLVELAEATGLGEQIQKAAEQAPKDLKGKIEDTVDRGKGFFEKVGGAIGGFVSDVFGGIGKAIEKAVGAVGEVAKGALKVAGKVATAPLDLAAAGLGAVGLDGAAKAVKKVDSAVESGYNFVGDQVDKFAEGAGAGLGGVVTGLGETIAHPIQTIKGVAHLVAHPEDLPKVGKAIWDEATKGGVSYALGYIAGNLAPALLSGGSTSGGTLTARLGSVLGESRLVTGAATLARTSKVGQAAGKVASVVSKSRVATFARTIPSKLGELKFANTLENVAGRVTTKIGQAEKIQAIATRFRAARGVIGESSAVKKIGQARQKLVEAQGKVLDKIQAGAERVVGRLDDSSLGKRVFEKAEARGLSQVDSPFQAGATPVGVARGSTEQRLQGLDNTWDTPDASDLKALEKDSFGAIQKSHSPNSRLRQRDGGVKPLNNGDRLEGSINLSKANGGGGQPNIIANFDAPEFQPLRQRAEALKGLPAEQRVREAEKLTREFLKRNTDGDDWNRLFESINDRHHPGKTLGASGEIDIAEYLKNGVADCRGFAVVHQMVLQEAGISSGLTYAKTFARQGSQEVAGVSHAFNVYEIGGKQFISDSFNPALSGISAKDAIRLGVQDEAFTYRFVPSPHSPDLAPDNLDGLAEFNARRAAEV
jgi:hypothetical protein